MLNLPVELTVEKNPGMRDMTMKLYFEASHTYGYDLDCILKAFPEIS
jgi:hypothetical protein